MSIFNLKLKTKNGNDIKKKETFTVFLTVNYKKSSLTNKAKIAEYTYRIMYSKGTEDIKRVLQLKDYENIKSVEDLTVKVVLNMFHLIGKITKKLDVDPDFILFISPIFGDKKNRSWTFLKDAFNVPPQGSTHKTSYVCTREEYEEKWGMGVCNKLGVNKDEVDLIRDFSELNSLTNIMTIDPNKDAKKYAKSINICNALQDRLDRNLQITEQV